MNASLTDTFLAHMNKEAPAFAKRVQETEVRQPALFRELSEPMLGWAREVIGDAWCDTLTDCYVDVLVDTNRGQSQYEREKHYQFSSYQDVFGQTYDDPEFMARYHWGWYITTFAWEHQLLLYDFFSRFFVTPLLRGGVKGRFIDLWCGSGIWSSLLLSKLQSWRGTLVDISTTSVDLTRKTLTCAGLSDRAEIHLDDALTFRGDSAFDAGISCFLLEHLEKPGQLLENLAAALGTRKLAFVTAALTSADPGHIFEFRKESEVVRLAEDSGFRVVASFSSLPPSTPSRAVLPPRSIALVLQKRAGDYW